MSVKLFMVDAFTDKPFSGNPAGVCLLRKPADELWMQNLAAEVNASETAFLFPEENDFRLRWFTPVIEVKLCGHATLASAHILWEQKIIPYDHEARFRTLSGLLTAKKEKAWITLNFPARPVKGSMPDWTEKLVGAVGVKPYFIGMSEEDVLVEVADEETLTELEPDFEVIRLLPVRGVIVTCRSKRPEFDFISRFFAPAVGVKEDPVTGSSHTVLGPFWSERLKKTTLRAYQASRRGGVLIIRTEGDRVKISGQAVTVFSGSLTDVP